ncbi:hypothetical protein RN001_011435 [Aquatica leii]|uniref:27 kDa hemolymph protein n=1 Tax=Aquatica leii TaxID=1421715 RepID=A0AAN7QDV3_9COLE|nr:hypothetical protein RN001_011435 [Aquatica leii]
MKVICALFFLFGVVYSNNILQNLPNFPGLASVPNLDDIANVETAVKDKCNKNGGEQAFQTLKSASADMQTYITKNFEFSSIKNEVEEARKTGSMDEVFKKYCDKRPEYRTHGHKVLDAFEACLTDDEKPVFKLAINITENIVNFICEKDGDRLGMFIAEDGFVCLSQKAEALQKCGADTVGSKIPTTFNTIPTLSITKEQCDDYKTIQKCVVKAMEGCENTTPANIVDAFMNYIYKFSTCKNLK